MGASPPASLHWAPSGDVYVLGADKEYRRIASLRAMGSGRCVIRRCEFRWTVAVPDVTWQRQADGCAFMSETGHRAPARRIRQPCICFRRRPAGCPGVLGWNEVRALGGQSVTLLDGGRVIRARPCNLRCQDPGGAAKWKTLIIALGRQVPPAGPNGCATRYPVRVGTNMRVSKGWIGRFQCDTVAA